MDRTKRGSTRSRRFAKLVVFTILMLPVTCLLAMASSAPLFSFSPFQSDIVNHMLNYQLSALLIVALALLLTFSFAGRVRLSYLSPRRHGEIRPILGRSIGDRWETDAWFLGGILAVIVGVVTFLQLLPGGFSFHWAHLALVVPFAAANAFTEEAIFRLPYVTMGDNSTNSRSYGLVMGSLVFGLIHYWGVAPNGLLGSLMAAWLGFLLAKSIQETKGFYWAFMIHFMLNLVGMTLVLNQTPSQ